jgi:hypothetical protein
MGAVAIRRAQVAHQQVSATEHIQRQKAVPVIKAVEVAPDLLAMHAVIGGVEVQRQALGWLIKRRAEALEQRLVRRPGKARVRALFDARQRRRRGQRLRARNGRLKSGIVTQRVLIVEIAVAQRHPEHALVQHRSETVIDAPLIARIAQAATHLLEQTDALLGLAQQQCTTIRGDRAAIEARFDGPATQA